MTNRSSFPPAQTAPKMSSALSLHLKSNELPRSTSPTSPGKTSRANHLPPSIHPPRRPSCWLLAAAAAAAAASSHPSYVCTPVSTPRTTPNGSPIRNAGQGLSRQDVLDGYEAMYGGDRKGKWPMRVRAVEETVVTKSCQRRETGLLTAIATPRWTLADGVMVGELATFLSCVLNGAKVESRNQSM
jgi:hypothetical protein